ncbi:glutathione S-transferase family protein [Vulcanococcus sp.]|jgi:glutathione S-transferase|uniref:glutathione S-transferase family protein n=1 Tax=Vulcanococcus sp. TaxID=2856995 RepID=UPI00322A1D08
MLELHQFRHSAFCEKVRLVLAYKRLPFNTLEVTPGVGQVELYRLSGQRQVPVLVDGAEVIADSTAIALYLEQQHPEPPLLPQDPAQRAQVLLLEDWADTALATGARLALLQAAALDSQLRDGLLPEATPSGLRSLLGALPGGVLSGVGQVLDASALQQLRHNLEQLNALLQAQPYVVGDQLSLADLAVMGQLSLIRFPETAGSALAGRGLPGLADDPSLEPLWRWRDALVRQLARP